MKKTLLVVSDASVATTGFGRVAEAVLDRLHDTGKWNIKQLGINYFDGDHDKPYRIFSATGGGVSKMDWLGYERIKPLFDEIKPDAVLLFQDFWHISEYIARIPNAPGIVAYFPVDAPNIKPTWAAPLAASTHLCTYTNFGAEEFAKSVSKVYGKITDHLKEIGKDSVTKVNFEIKNGTLDVPAKRIKDLCDPKNIHVIPHGVDQGKFFPVDKREARKRFDFKDDLFIVGNVNRNQYRKRLDLSLVAFSEFAKDKEDVLLVMHDTIKSHEGWDLPQLAEHLGISEKVYISETRLTNEDLNLLYNTFDVSINSGGGEGWGLTAMESASCKVPQILPNWSATKEIWEGYARLIDIQSVHYAIGRLNNEHAVIDTGHLAEILNEFYEDRSLAQEVGELCFEVTQRPEYSWDAIAHTFDKILTEAAEQRHPDFETIQI